MTSHDPGPTADLLEALFEEVARPFVKEYETLEGALDAVASRRKAMECVTWAVADIQECYEDQIDFQAMAAARKLTVVQMPDDVTSHAPFVRVYALYPENLWRATAHVALLTVYRKDLRWSNEAEDLQSYLFGYTEDERRVWHAYNDWRQLGWNGLSIYFLMNRHSRERIQALASRCIDPALADQGIVAAFPLSNMAVKKDGVAWLPADTFLARATVRHAFLHTLYGPPDSRPQTTVQSRVLTGELIDEINRALVSSLQFLTADGWR